MQRSIKLSYEESIRYATGKDFKRHSIGIHSLLYNYRNDPKTWKVLINIFHNRRVESTDPFLLYVFSLIPRHSDILWDETNTILEEVKLPVVKILSKFSKKDVIKLLSFVEESDVERGSLGQCVAAIISFVHGKKVILEQIIRNKRLARNIRWNALIFLSYFEGDNVVSLAESVRQEEHEDPDDDMRELASYILECFKVFGYVPLY